MLKCLYKLFTKICKFYIGNGVLETVTLEIASETLLEA